MLKIIISPAKKMNILDEYSFPLTKPVFMKEAKYLHRLLKDMSRDELKQLWQCSDKLADQNYKRLHTFHLEKNLTPALLAYEGIQYQYMAPQIFSDSEWNYAMEHLYILSGFYGLLRPSDGVIPYRLEMQAKLKSKSSKDLYEFWGSQLYRKLTQTDSTADNMARALPKGSSPDQNIQILNLASAEYSKAVLPFVQPPAAYVTCIFGEKTDGKVKMKGTQAKIARGEMVRWMAENQIENIADLHNFDRLGYTFQEDLSTQNECVFLINRAR